MFLLLLLSACAGGNEGCALVPVGTLQVQLVDGVPVAVVGINGRPAALLLDIGSDITLLSRSAARRLGVPFDKRLTEELDGIGGKARSSSAVLATVQLGDTELADVPAVVGRGLEPPIDGVLGIGALAAFDLDLDAPNGTVSLYRARPPACAGAPPPWTGRHVRLQVEKEGSGHLFIPAVLDGVSVRALLDTGASRSTVGLPAAAATGLTEAQLLSRPASVIQSVDAKGIVVRPRRFRTLEVGGEVTADPLLNVADLPAQAGDMIIGSDYLGSRRMWIALGSSTVFAATPDQPRPR